jgi:hypothetical protein
MAPAGPAQAREALVDPDWPVVREADSPVVPEVLELFQCWLARVSDARG